MTVLLGGLTASGATALAGETRVFTPATIVGTPGDDAIVGTAGHDVIVGLGGGDVIRGFGGSDSYVPAKLQVRDRTQVALRIRGLQ